MKKKLIYFIFLLLPIIKVNGQEEILTQKDTIISQLNGCEYTIIKNRYTIDTLYANIDQKVRVQFFFCKLFSENKMGKSEDTVATLVGISPAFCTIHYLESDKLVKILSMKYIKRKYKRIIIPVIKSASLKTKGEKLYNNGNPNCLNFTYDELSFYVFPLHVKN